jgi:DNA-binding protein HU-beta
MVQGFPKFSLTRCARLRNMLVFPGVVWLQDTPENGHKRIAIPGRTRPRQWGIYPEGVREMAKAMTKSRIMSALAEKLNIKKKAAAEFVAALVGLAYKEAKNGFTIAGLGKLILVNRKERMGRNPATGEPIKILAKKMLKFRVAKAAKEAVLKK